METKVRLGAVVGLSLLLLPALAACTTPDPPVFALGSYAARNPAVLTGKAAERSVVSTGGVAGSSGGGYSLEVVDFDRNRFDSVADCFTAASARQLPPDLCRER